MKSVSESIFLQACKGQRSEVMPIWLMRQAGRYQPKYRALREKYSFLELCSNPELIAEVTLIPFSYAPFDAAIIFSDITIVLRALGVEFSVEEHVGPVMKTPLQSVEEIRRLEARPCADVMPYLYQGIRMACSSLKVPLIGFAAAPFTLASYLMAGKAGRENANARRFMLAEPDAWNDLMKLLVDVSVDYLRQQVLAGAAALQIFDSWIGELSPATYHRFMFPHMQRLFRELAALQVPLIHFGTGTAMLLEQMSLAGGDVIGVDWKTPIAYAHAVVKTKPLMGNLDPAALLAPWEALKTEAGKVLEQTGVAPAHIFNLGHGIMPKTPVENVQRLVDYVHEWRSEQ